MNSVLKPIWNTVDSRDSINPRRACAARITVVVCVCAVMSVRYSTSHFQGPSIGPQTIPRGVFINVEIIIICGVFSETAAFWSYGLKNRLTSSGSVCSVYLEGTRIKSQRRACINSRMLSLYYCVAARVRLCASYIL